ncbi:MAG: 4'-phosphopantetheinyl transferase superfamily protein [Acidobacteria bacterium]|nr:4'-phosphopantetheinyl transferase superfamily protein [Acidobacteriota bacterium]
MQVESTSQIVWELSPDELRLAPNEIHLWCADLAAHTFPLESLQALLSEDELSRARKFHFLKDQTQFTVARGLLRRLLGRYLQADPASLRFGYGAQGKPWVMNEHGSAHSLRFNLAHSAELILYAVSWEQELGIDVEQICTETSDEAIAEHFFSPAEVAALRSLPLAQQPQAFFNCWTRKEAYLKARSEGLSFPLNGFEVSLDSQLPVRLKVYQSPHESDRWRLYPLNPKPQYVGAVVVEGQSHVFQFFSTRGL